MDNTSTVITKYKIVNIKIITNKISCKLYTFESSLRESFIVSFKYKFPVELNSFSDTSQKMNSIQREISTPRKQWGMYSS